MRVKFAPVGKVRQIGVLLQAKEVVQVPVQFKGGDHVNVPLASVNNDVPNLVLGESRALTEERITGQLNAGFAVKRESGPGVSSGAGSASTPPVRWSEMEGPCGED
jgi:hypothetical protein